FDHLVGAGEQRRWRFKAKRFRGADQCSESRLQLVRRFAAAAVLAERMESQLANGAEINIAEHAVLCSTLVRLAQRIRINRVPKNITPSLADYLEQQQQQAAE